MKVYSCEQCEEARPAEWAINNGSGGEFYYCRKCKEEIVRKLTPDEKAPSNKP